MNPFGSDPVEAAVTRYRFSDVELDLVQGELRVHGRRVDIEPRPFRVLLELLAHANEVVTKDELFDRVWDGRDATDGSLTNAISKVRAALGPQHAQRILTISKTGYRLVGAVDVDREAARPSQFQLGDLVPTRPEYRLESLLGQTTRSAVYLCRHSKLGHLRVFKFSDNPAGLSALKREFTLFRVLTAELGQRREWVAIYGANFVQAPYHLESEYGGTTLAAWADAGALSGLPIERRLELFVRIADAVALAHGVGVLHKDLKPTNILLEVIDQDPKPRLTDFGSGRLVEPGRLAALGVTATGTTVSVDTNVDSRSATLMYAAPEILAGHAATVQADVYALGILLFQLAVADLQRPLVTGWQREVADELLQGDIAAATEGQVALRVSSAAALADRIRNLPYRRQAAEAAAAQARIEAQQAVLLHQVRARRPWVIATVVMLAVALAATAWLNTRERQARRDTDQALTQVRLINDFLLHDLLVSPDLSAAGGRSPVTLLELLRRASIAARHRFEGQAHMEAAVRRQLATTFRRLSSVTDADMEYLKAQELLRPLLPANHPQLLALQFERVALLVQMGQAAEARANLDAAEQAAGPALGEAPDELAVLAARAKTEVQVAEGQLLAARKSATRLIELVDSVSSQGLAERVDARRLLAHVLVMLQDEQAADQVLASLDHHPFNREPASSAAHHWVNMMKAAAHRDAGRHAQAEAILLDTIKRLERDQVPSHWHLGYARSERGHNFKAAGDLDRAAASYTEAIESFRAALGSDHQFVRITAINLANTELARGRPTEALAICRANEPWFRTHATKGYYGNLELTAAGALIKLGRSIEALSYLDRYPRPGPDDLPSGIGHWAWIGQAYRGVALRDSGRVREGQKLIDEARAILANAGKLPTGIELIDSALVRLGDSGSSSRASPGVVGRDRLQPRVATAR